MMEPLEDLLHAGVAAEQEDEAGQKDDDRGSGNSDTGDGPGRDMFRVYWGRGVRGGRGCQ